MKPKYGVLCACTGSQVCGAGLELTQLPTRARLVGTHCGKHVVWMGVEAHVFHLYIWISHHCHFCRDKLSPPDCHHNNRGLWPGRKGEQSRHQAGCSGSCLHPYWLGVWGCCLALLAGDLSPATFSLSSGQPRKHLQGQWACITKIPYPQITAHLQGTRSHGPLEKVSSISCKENNGEN